MSNSLLRFNHRFTPEVDSCCAHAGLSLQRLVAACGHSSLDVRSWTLLRLENDLRRTLTIHDNFQHLRPRRIGLRLRTPNHEEWKTENGEWRISSWRYKNTERASTPTLTALSMLGGSGGCCLRLIGKSKSHSLVCRAQRSG